MKTTAHHGLVAGDHVMTMQSHHIATFMGQETSTRARVKLHGSVMRFDLSEISRVIFIDERERDFAGVTCTRCMDAYRAEEREARERSEATR